MRRVLVIRFSSLGDITLTLPTVERLAAQGFEVHFLTKKAFVPLIAAHGIAKSIHAISDHAPLSELRVKVAELKKFEFECVYDLHRNLRSFFVSGALGGQVRRIGKYRLKEFFLYVFRAGVFRLLGFSPIARWAEALRLVGEGKSAIGGPVGTGGVEPAGKSDGRSVSQGHGVSYGQDLPHSQGLFHSGLGTGIGGFGQLQTISAAVVQVRRLAAHRLIVCIAGESAWPQKQWPVDRFIAVGQELQRQGAQVVWMGLKSVPEAAQRDGMLDLTKKLDLTEVAAVLRQATMLICNDSGLMHIAESVGTPVVALFGPTTRELGFGPRLPKSRIVERKLWCRPCSKTGRMCFRVFRKQKCLTDIQPAEVLEAVKPILETAAVSQRGEGDLRGRAFGKAEVGAAPSNQLPSPSAQDDGQEPG